MPTPCLSRKTTFIAPILLSIVACLLAAPLCQADTNLWVGPGAGSNNWSTGANWTDLTAGTSGTSPGATNDVAFFDSGAATTASNINNVVDSGFAGTIASLRYGNTNNFHTTLIAAGQTLILSGTNGLVAGTAADPGSAKNFTNVITGPGASLVINNTSANISINQATAASGADRANLDLSGVDSFVVNGNRIGIGDGQFPGVSLNNHVGGNLILAKTNSITLAYTNTLANYQTAGINSAINISRNSGNNPAIISLLQLGLANTFNVDSLNIGMDKSANNSTPSHGILKFNPAFAGMNPTANFYGIGGPGTRVTWWSIGDANKSASSSNGGGGTNDFSLGTINAFVNVMSLARDASSASDAWAGPHKGVFLFANGTVDVNTLILGNQALETGTSTTPCLGVFDVIGGGALLRVNTVMTMGNTTLSSAAGLNTASFLNVTNGAVYANSIAVGASSVTNAINLVNGTLIVSNTLATNAAGLFALNISNSTLGLTVPPDGSLRGLTKTLNTIGSANLIQLNPSPVIFSSYPQQFPLLKYTTWAGSNTFMLASVPPWAPGATVVSNGPNQSLDLVLPYDPRPVITNNAGQPLSTPASPEPGQTVVLSIGVSPNSVTPLGYQWFLDGAALADGATGDGSTNSGSASGMLTIYDAQTNDSGNYMVVITNLYGVTTSSVLALTISSNAVAPSITGPGNVTVIEGNTATLSTTVSGRPVPVLQWQFNGSNLTDGPGAGGAVITGSTNNVLTIANTQYPTSQGTYSLIASNAAGMVTNSGFLTVIVPPAILLQPLSLVVTNTQPASFTVSASGVPALAYQWFKNGSPISPAVNSTATNATFALTSAAPGDIATYFCAVTNAAGATNSINVTLTVNSAGLTVVSLSPTNGRAGVCYDTPLYITFSQPPSLGTAGKVQIFNATNSAAPVDTLDLSQGSPQARTIGGETFSSYPIIITGNQAALYPRGGMLSSNQSYYVTIDDGVFTDSAGAYFAGITSTNAWVFATKTGGPANPTNLVVAQDYSGDFATVQGALDSLPANNTTPTIIHVNNGLYTEIVNVHSKSGILLRGQSRNGVIIGYANNSSLNGSTHFRMAIKVNANDISFDNLTLTNMTAQDFSQAEALMIESGAQRAIINNCNVDSYQDTILANISTSKAYFKQSLVQGDVDFIWGGGNLFFTNCEIRWLIRAGNAAALGPNPSPTSTDIGSNGFSFVNCALTTLPGANPNDIVGRTRGITNGNTVLINCFVSTNIGGWNSDALPTNNFRNWYFGCTNDLGAPVTLSNAIPLGAGDPNVALASSATSWLYGWAPQLSLNIVSQPASQSVAGGQTATFTVSATGIPDPTYQWLKNGTNLPGATNATLTLTNCHAGDAGSYSVTVSNASGSVTSSAATLTVGNTAPTLAPVADQDINVGDTFVVTNVAFDPDVPPQTLTFSLLAGPANATLGAASGVFTWRPQVSQANSSNVVTVAVADNGSPNLSATNTFSIVVNALSQPDVSSATWSAGQFSLTVAGQTGPDYAVQASTDLILWQTVFATNSPSMPFLWTDPNSAGYAARFYRIVVGPPLP